MHKKLFPETAWLETIDALLNFVVERLEIQTLIF